MIVVNRKDVYLSVRERLDEELGEMVRATQVARLAEMEAQAAANPQYPDIRFRLAHLYYIAGRLDDALRELASALDLNDRFHDALSLKATILAHQGQLEAALALYRRMIELKPNDAESHYRSAVLLGRLGRHADAMKSAQTALEANSGHALAHLFLGAGYLAEEDWPQAMTHYRAAHHLRPHEDSAYMLGLLALRVGDGGEAERWLEEALEHKPNHLNALVRLAMIKMAEGAPERAYVLLQRAVGFYPTYPDLVYGLAKVALLLGRREEAYAHMRNALELNPRYAEVRRDISCLYHAQRRNRDAVHELQQSLEIDPDDEQAYINLGFIHSNHGEHEAAIEVLEKAIGKFPDSWRLYHSLGIVHLQDRLFPKARALFLAAVKINPEIEAYQRNLRIAFHDESLLEEERQRLLGLYSSDEQEPELNFHLGVLHVDFHQEKAAVNYLQRALEAGYRTSEVNLLLACVYANLQSFDLALSALERVSFSGVHESLRKLLLGLFHANAGDHDVAARWYQQVMTEAPLLFHAVHGLPVCFREREELDDLLDDYLDYARFYERSGDLFCRIGEIYANKGMLVEAKGHFHHAAILDPESARAYHALGVLALLRLDFSMAVDAFLQAVERAPEWGLPHLCLGLIYDAQGRATLASVSLKRYVQLEPKNEFREPALRLLETNRHASKAAVDEPKASSRPRTVLAGQSA